MKKITLTAIIVLFALASAAFTPWLAVANTANSELATSTSPSGKTLEKILSPKLISLYKEIKKIGNTLWGVKKENKDETKVLEKISAPHLMPWFENIQRRGNALWGFRIHPFFLIATASSSPCVIAAIEAKDKAIIENSVSQNNEFVAAVNARTACQKTALSTTEKQRENLAKCASAFNNEWKASQQKYFNAQKSIWKTYKESLMVCTKLHFANIATTTSFMIEDGGDN